MSLMSLRPVTLALALLAAGGCSLKVATLHADATDAGPDAVLAVAAIDASRAAYPADLPVAGNAAARAVALHGRRRLDLINLSNVVWPAGGRVWVNGRYATTLPDADPGVILKFGFDSLTDIEGITLADSRREVVERVEVELAGELTNVRFALHY